MPPADRTEIRYNPGPKRYNFDRSFILRASYPGPQSAPGAKFCWFLIGTREGGVYSGSQDRTAEPINTQDELFEVMEMTAIALKVYSQDQMREMLGLQVTA